jgi:hypothetical protein
MTAKYPRNWREIPLGDGSSYHERVCGEYRVIPAIGQEHLAELADGTLIARCASLSLAMVACRDHLEHGKPLVYRLNEIPSAIAEGIMAAKVDPKHEHLNALLDDGDESVTAPVAFAAESETDGGGR